MKLLAIFLMALISFQGFAGYAFAGVNSSSERCEDKLIQAQILIIYLVTCQRFDFNEKDKIELSHQGENIEENSSFGPYDSRDKF